MESGEKHDESEAKDGEAGRVWILVDHSSREAAMAPIARQLEERGLSVELVTITEVIGSAAREALAGGAERILRGLRVAMRGRTGDEDLIGAFRRRQPDVLVVTEPRYARSIGVLENLTGVKSLQVGLVPDFVVDSGWFNGQLNAFIVPDETTRQSVMAEGIDPERVKVAGPALRPNFRRDLDREKIREEMGLADSLVVLVRADGLEPAKAEKLVFQCTLSDQKARFIFHHDGDGATASALRRAAEQYGLSAAMFGRVADLERYFAAADAVLASDADPYLPELLESKTPLLFVPSGRPGRGNADALASRELAEYLDDMGQLGTRLDRFLKKENLQERREKSARWNGVERHDQLVETLEEIVSRADEWRMEVSAPAAEKDVEEGEEKVEEPPAPRGPFETIGGAPPRPRREEARAGKEEGDGAERPRDFSRLSRAEAQEQLAQLILKERDFERRLQELEKQQERWRGRLQLAREWNETDLAEEAEGILRGFIDEAEPMEEELGDIRRQKEKLKAAARGGDGAPSENGGESGADRASRLEERFQKMEVDRDLDGLRDRIKRELGE